MLIIWNFIIAKYGLYEMFCVKNLCLQLVIMITIYYYNNNGILYTDGIVYVK